MTHSHNTTTSTAARLQKLWAGDELYKRDLQNDLDKIRTDEDIQKFSSKWGDVLVDSLPTIASINSKFDQLEAILLKTTNDLRKIVNNASATGRPNLRVVDKSDDQPGARRSDPAAEELLKALSDPNKAADLAKILFGPASRNG